MTFWNFKAPKQLVASLIWNLSEWTGIGLGKYAPILFGWMINAEDRWKITKDELPGIGDQVEYSEDGVNSEGSMVYLESRTCMMAGIAGGHGYFGEGFATDGENGCDYGLICDDPKYWRLK